jgi:heparosan-N-sulfate-glucuronate 5-epimerase
VSIFTFSILLTLLLTLLTSETTQAAVNSALKQEVDRFNQSLVYDDMGVPYYNYSSSGHYSIGLQGNPHAVSQNALLLYKKLSDAPNETVKTYFINNVNWLVNTKMLKNNGSFSSYEFSFPWQIGNNTIQPPWRSGMANAEALSPLVKAFHVTGNNTYLNTAKRLLSSFYVDTKDGGVTYKSPSSGWWYEQYASINSSGEPRALSGMMNAILAINEYYKDIKDPSAKFLLDQGILALKNDVPKYDNNGIIYYDRMGLSANSFYRSSYVVLLENLYKLTNEPIFKIYHDKWDNYNTINKS